MTTKGTLRRISPAELDEILIQVHQEGYRELVLLGPEIRLSPSPEDWPDELKSRSILQLTESVAGLAERLLDLNQLQLLTLHGNQIGEAGAGAIAEHPTGLTSLDLRGNSNLKSMNAFSNLSMLRKLIISETGETDLSPLKGLIERGLPVKWEEYPFGHGIAVYDCPLVKPTPEVINQGREAVLNYFREIEAQEIDRLYEAKVLILGEGGAGKTSLVRRLYFPDQPLPTEDETTRGIEVYLQEFFTSENRTFRLNVWDFGGQQIYHATHQFFSPRVPCMCSSMTRGKTIKWFTTRDSNTGLRSLRPSASEARCSSSRTKKAGAANKSMRRA